MGLERQFSKELAQELRDETANKLNDARKKPESFSELRKGMKGKKELPEDFNTWSEAKQEIEALKKDIWGRIFKTEEYKKQELYINQVLVEKRKYDIWKVQKEYNEKFNEILENCPLTEEEKSRYLSTEAMENMELDDYLVLLKRLSGEAFYHVTRYGVRENTFMSTGGGHTEGEGRFINSFEPLLKDGRINSFASTIVKDINRAKSLINKEEILSFKKEGKSVDEILDIMMRGLSSAYFLDAESAHFSYGKELHHMYGGEDNYKFYYYYPVEYFLHNDFFHSTREGQINIGKDYFHNKCGIEQQYNDFEIFNFGKGVPINAGILCITGDVEVDPETGSQYLLKNGKPEMDEKGKFKKPDNTISSKEYWENYFKSNPEIKPNKIIYSEYNTISYKQSHDLENWAKTKNIHYQDENKKQEFVEYRNNSKEEIRKLFKKIIEEEFNK
jgi:hypothetical protein